MRQKRWALLPAITLTVGLLFGSFSAMAEDMTMVQDTVQLLQEGAFPDATPTAAAYPQSEVQSFALRSTGTVSDALYQGLWNCQKTIDISAYRVPVDDMHDVYQNLINTSPELFYLGSRYQYTYSGPNVVTIIPTYTYTGTTLKTMRTEYQQKLEAILAKVDTAWSDWEIALYLHDYLAAYFEYDYTYTHYDAYSFLTTGNGVCQAYSLTYIALLKSMGIPVDYVSSRTMNHGWNAVNIGGNWYHVDITWDDVYGYGLAGHQHFLVSDERMGALDHENWYYTVENRSCTSTIYDDSVWTTVRTPFVPLEDQWYYIGEQRTGGYAICSTDGQASTERLSLNARWYVSGSSSYWNGFYSGLGLYRDKVILNTDTAICSYDPQTNRLQTLYEPEASDASIYGMTIDGVQVTYALKASPNEQTEERRTVALADLTRIAVAALPTKTAYLVGEDLDTTGLQLTLTYSDSTTKTISEGFTTSGFDSQMVGSQTITVAYEEQTTSFHVTVNRPDYTVTYDANGGSDAPAEQTFQSGDSIRLSATLPVRPGYTFAGWATAEEPDLLYPSGAFCWFEGDTVLYAVWTPDGSGEEMPDWGNIDGQNGVTAADALVALQAATGKVQLTDTQAAVVDVDENGEITAGDALLILQYATQKIDRFPAQR